MNVILKKVKTYNSSLGKFKRPNKNGYFHPSPTSLLSLLYPSPSSSFNLNIISIATDYCSLWFP